MSQGNPPSGVAAWYCLVDAVAMTWADPVLHGFARFFSWVQVKLKKISSEQFAFDESGVE
jgi:hypothetical protein